MNKSSERNWKLSSVSKLKHPLKICVEKAMNDQMFLQNVHVLRFPVSPCSALSSIVVLYHCMCVLARHLIIGVAVGAFVLIVIIIGFGCILWLKKIGPFRYSALS